ncbi:acyl-CoA thioesterase II [Pseudomonas sp. PDM31]|uniref:acyl-CoA thioesterase n=1 Tax=Pseudomonas sp. PDM31 TaxID=2854778 RepID=UPI001C437875|nr:acyl-CoA thioesterase domain-containing protein [Pseudomonas sp. PDM31]MBV7477540.1 thioesterase family protein [Pseudomonas sp. PDM31]
MQAPSSRIPRPDDFASLLRLDFDGEDFISRHGEANLTGNAFGGQLMAQAVAAAGHGLDPHRRLRSLHATFLKPLPLDPQLRYQVQTTLQGRSFSNLEVQSQRGLQVAFRASLCFQTEEEGPSHQDSAPEVPGPEALPDLADLADLYQDRLSEGNQRLLKARHLHELRPVDGEAFLFCGDRKPSMRYWIRSSERLSDDPRLHEAALVYMSDAWINSAMLLPHVATRMSRDFFAPTLTHDLWLHRSFRADEWLLFDVHSPSLHGETGLINAAVYDRNGRLVANAAQHALFRQLG